jgi:hypothetical protein
LLAAPAAPQKNNLFDGYTSILRGFIMKEIIKEILTLV